MAAAMSTLDARDSEFDDIYSSDKPFGIGLILIFVALCIGPFIMILGAVAKRVLLHLERGRPQLQDPLHRYTIHALLLMHMETECPRCTIWRLRNAESEGDHDEIGNGSEPSIDHGPVRALAYDGQNDIEMSRLPPREPDQAHVRH